MNILPKKRWHVRTKENIARVRRDEALAAEQEQERLRRVALAEQEFRTSILRKQAAERRGAIGGTSSDHPVQLGSGQDPSKNDASIVGTSGHINFFQHLEKGERVAGPNEEYLREQREEKEKYEKSIGYLTYLGQGSREETKTRAWFETLPVNRAEERQRADDEEVKRKAKASEDPLMVVKKLVGCERDDTSRASSAKRAPPHSPEATRTADRQTVGQPSNASTDECSAKRTKKDSNHERREKRGKKKKHSKKKNGRDRNDRRHSKSKKRRRRSPSPSDSSSSEGSSSAEEAEARRIQLERLRAERLQRERQERQRAERLLSGLHAQSSPSSPSRPGPPEPRLKQRYNAQFNPYLARQNYRPC